MLKMSGQMAMPQNKWSRAVKNVRTQSVIVINI